jgi:hypothetical protein
MALSDAVSCLLCLDAFERPTMLRIHLRPIGGGDPREYYLCQRCGGAIAAEYLYVQNSGKAESAIEVGRDHNGELRPDPDLRPPDQTSGIVQPPIDEAMAGVGEVKTLEAREESAETPRKGKKEGRKESV